MEDYLIHYGVLGMKWGVRRYQNEDGTRTSLGKSREAAERRSEKRSEAKAAREAKRQFKREVKAKRTAEAQAEKERLRQAELKRQRMIAQINNRKNLSDDDIKNLTERLKAEKNLRELSESELEPGKAFVKSFLKSSAKEAAEKISKVVMLKIAREIAIQLGHEDVANAIFQSAPEKKKKDKE